MAGNNDLDTLERENARLRSANADNLTEIERLKVALRLAEKNYAEEERSHGQTMTDRDCHEESLNQLFAALGMSESESEWSSCQDPSVTAIEVAHGLIDKIAALEARAVAAETNFEDMQSQWSNAVREKHELCADRDALAALAEELRVALEGIAADAISAGAGDGMTDMECLDVHTKAIATRQSTPSSALDGLKRWVRVECLRKQSSAVLNLAKSGAGSYSVAYNSGIADAAVLLRKESTRLESTQPPEEGTGDGRQ
jgi:hypothetical protein